MGEKTLSVRTSFKEAWDFAKGHWGFLLGYGVIDLAVTALMNITQLREPTLYPTVVGHIIAWVLFILVNMGFYRVAILLSRGISPTYEEVYKNYPHFLYWVVGWFLFSLGMAIGLLLLIIPGLYFLACFGMFAFFLLDQNLGPIAAFGEAKKATQGVRGKLFLLFLACTLLNILGALLLGLGLLFTLPITLLALAAAYKKITENSLSP